jgi:hypothetical protein
LAAALTWLFRGSVVGENIVEASKGEPVAVLANFNQDEKNFSAADAKSSFGIWRENSKHLIFPYHHIKRKLSYSLFPNDAPKNIQEV